MTYAAMISSILLCSALPLAARAQSQSTDARWRAQVRSAAIAITDQQTGRLAHQRDLETRDHTIAPDAALLFHQNPQGFLVALTGAAEMWFIALDEDAGPYHDGFVHSYLTGMEESLASEEGRFARLRIDLSQPLTALAHDPADPRAIYGWRADGTCIRVHLIAKREIGPCPQRNAPDEQ